METDVTKLRANLTKLLVMAKGTSLVETIPQSAAKWEVTTKIGTKVAVDINSIASHNEIDAILGQMGDVGRCRACNERIFWIWMEKSGKRNPIQCDGVSHFSSCPDAGKFRKDGR